MCQEVADGQASAFLGEHDAHVIDQAGCDEHEPDLEGLGDELQGAVDVVVLSVEFICSFNGVLAIPLGVAISTGTPCTGADDMMGEVEPEEGGNGRNPEQTEDVGYPMQEDTRAAGSTTYRGRGVDMADKVGGRPSDGAIGSEGFRLWDRLVHRVHSRNVVGSQTAVLDLRRKLQGVPAKR